MTGDVGTMVASGAAAHVPPAVPEDALRAEMYSLLATLLRAAPSPELLDTLTRLDGDDSEMGTAANALARLAQTQDEGRIRREYHDLFVGIGRGELVPFGSYYLTGFLNEKPLGELRGHMRMLGIERAEGVKQPEDHIAALMEMMSGLILGSFAGAADGNAQAEFFRRHVDSWARHFFQDLEGARSAVFYAPVGTMGRVLMEVEAQAFAMA